MIQCLLIDEMKVFRAIYKVALKDVSEK